MTGWALSHSLMVFSPGNWPMPWKLSGNSLMRSSVDLIGVVSWMLVMLVVVE